MILHIQYLQNNCKNFAQISWACSMGNKDCLNKARENFGDWMGMVEPDSESANP